MVASRTNEIGVRMALGAARGDVVRMVLRDSFWMVGTGVLVGAPCAWAGARTLRTLLFGLEPVDPRIGVLSLLVLIAAALSAAWIPARRAAGIDPMRALREE
jgi:ABC-type antimicrobial peptide transport system permease subunit